MDNISSISTQNWRLKKGEDRLGLLFAQRLGLPESIGRLLAARGLSTLEEVELFLNPTLKASVPDPYLFKDMERATLRLEKALLLNEKIVLYGDYDVDGATSTALFKKFFNALGKDARIYIPDRIKEGYGPNIPAFQSFHENGISLIVTLDSGTTSFEALDFAAENNMDVVVIDHHISEPTLPKAHALVNPNRGDESALTTKKYGNLAAVGVSFLVLVALNRLLRENNFYEDHSLQEPDLRIFLDLVALGTVADVVSLTGLNRTFVSQGLKIMKNRTNIGLSALTDIANLQETPQAYHAGFILGPRINAGGRVGESHLGAHLLSTDCPENAKYISEKLNILNQERKDMEQIMLDQAVRQVEDMMQDSPLPAALVLAQESWHPGIIGIIAGRIKDQYHRPTCIIALENGIGKASGRSLGEVNLGALIHLAKKEHLLLNGGGHAMAAGFTIEEHHLPNFRNFFVSHVSKILEETQYIPTLYIDAALSLEAITPEYLKTLERLTPFGMGNPTPRFMIQHVRVVSITPLQNTHLRCILKSENGTRQEAMAFRAIGTPLGEALLSAQQKSFHFVGTFRLDTWGGREKIQMILEDAAYIL